MRNLLLLTVLFNVCFLPDAALTGQEDSDMELTFVIVMFRHGDRTPVATYPTDPYKDRNNWPADFGQLTSRGKMMQYELGKYFRNRYGNLLGEDYDPDLIYVRSTDVDRTLMSALSNLAGLYPPPKDQVWNENLAWRPIPVHTVDVDTDNLLSAHAHCPRFNQLVLDVLNKNETVQQLNKKYADLYEYVSLNTNANVSNMVEIDYIYDTLFVESVYNKTLPHWTKKVFPGKMKYLRDLSFTLTTWTHELKRLRNGPLLSHVISEMKSVRGNKTASSNYTSSSSSSQKKIRRMHMLSGHDTTLSSFLNGLGMFDPPIAPPYASTVMIELYRRKKKKLEEEDDEEDGDDDRIEVYEYYVQFLYRNDSSRDPYVLTLPGCETLCPLDKFDELTKDLRPRDWSEECRATGDSSDSDPLMTLISRASIIVAISLALIVMIAVIITVTRKSKLVNQHEYVAVNQGNWE